MLSKSTYKSLAASLAVAVLMLAGLGFATAVQNENAETSPQPKVVVEVQGLHYDAGKPVQVRVTARNESDTEIANPLANPLVSGFKLTGPDGKSYSAQDAGKSTPQTQPNRLAPLSYFGQVVDLAAHFPVLTNIGAYKVSYTGGNELDLNVIQVYNPDADYKAVLKTASGELTMQLFRADAPLTVRNFVDLARQGFYNGLTFHYIRPGDLMMAGDPQGDGSGGSGFFLPAEFNENQHLSGTVAMVRGSDPNSASSQFYICLKPQPERDGRFTVFAQVVEGMETLSKLATTPTSEATQQPYYRPLEPVVIESITIIESTSAEGS